MKAPRFEKIRVAQGPRSGATISIAVHSTRLGPALGGARVWRYPDEASVTADAKRLAQAMTYKAAAAGLALGGGKGAIAWPGDEPPQGEERRAMLLDFGDAVESLGGSYVTAEDVGTCAADMAVIRERTAHVVGLPEDRGGTGDPSPVTARGVLAAIHACLEHRFGDRSPAGRRVCLIGAGHVGSHLARLLTAEGAELVLSDLDDSCRALAAELGAGWADPADSLAVPCHVLAPCALGGVVDARTAEELRCEIVCGAANNILADDSAAETLHDHDILYAPDFVANAGGLISVYAELHALPRDEVLTLADGIEAAIGDILESAAERGGTPLAAARRIAEERLSAERAAAAA